MANLFFLPFRPAYDSNMRAIPGAQAYFTLTESNVAANIYADETLTTPLENPVSANGVGRFPTIWLDETVNYRVRVFDADANVETDVPLEEYDPYGSFETVFGLPALADQLVAGDNITITPDPDTNTLEIAAASTASQISAGRNIELTTDPLTGITEIAESGLSGQSHTSTATLTPVATNDLIRITAQAAALAIANPTGTPEDGHGILIRVKDNGTARAITFGTAYAAIGVTLPTTTVAGKWLYIGIIWNADAAKWDVISVAQQV